MILLNYRKIIKFNSNIFYHMLIFLINSLPDFINGSLQTAKYKTEWFDKFYSRIALASRYGLVFTCIHNFTYFNSHFMDMNKGLGAMSTYFY